MTIIGCCVVLLYWLQSAITYVMGTYFFFSSRRRHTRFDCDWSSDVCSSDLLLRWEVSQPGNVLRVFERGGRKKGEVGNPERDEDPGRPEDKLGERGFGTLLRSEEHTSELQSQSNLVCRLLLEKKKRRTTR